MIISCHIPKTAGTSFRYALEASFGNRLYLDYGDRVGWSGDQAETWRRGRGLPEAIKSDSIEVIHGHFYLKKYLDIDRDTAMVTFLREPIDRVISNYRFLYENPQIDHPLVKEFHQELPTLLEWANLPQARDLQSKVLNGCHIEKLAFVGITERYRESLLRFDSLFNTDLANLDTGEFHNKSTNSLIVSKRERNQIAMLNRADHDLYATALSLFHSIRPPHQP